MVLSVRAGNKTPMHAIENISVPRPKKARMSQAQVKTTLICIFDHKGIVHFEFLEQGQTVNQHCYLEILARLHETVRWRRPELWPVVGSCIMTMPLLMTCSLSGSFWPKN
jgi:hypothetical protein